MFKSCCISIFSNLGSEAQAGRGHLAVYSTSPQSFIITILIGLLNNFLGLILNFDWLIHIVECSNVSTIEIYRRGNFVYHHLGCTSINWPLSLNPCGSLAAYAFAILTSRISSLLLNCCMYFHIWQPGLGAATTYQLLFCYLAVLYSRHNWLIFNDPIDSRHKGIGMGRYSFLL